MLDVSNSVFYLALNLPLDLVSTANRAEISIFAIT